MKKSLTIYMPKLSVGGMEKALVDLLRLSNIKDNYNVILKLCYVKEKKYLDNVPSNIEIEIFCKGKWNLFGKIITSFKLVLEYLFTKKSDVSICYSHHHPVLAKITRKCSDNNIVFIHNDLLKFKEGKKLEKFLNKMKLYKFSKVVCVSNAVKKSFLTLYPNYNGKIVVINNYIDGKTILEKSKEKIKDIQKEKITTFINISRHDDNHKKVSRIINATSKLIKENYNFRVLLIGTGKDTEMYKKMINNLKLNDYIKMIGLRVNPYPYLKISDAFVFSSNYEGYGIVLDESRVLGIPIISTDVADAKIILNEGYGILCKNSEDGIYKGMKEFLIHGYKINNKFNYIEFNKLLTEKIDNILK